MISDATGNFENAGASGTPTKMAGKRIAQIFAATTSFDSQSKTDWRRTLKIPFTNAKALENRQYLRTELLETAS